MDAPQLWAVYPWNSVPGAGPAGSLLYRPGRPIPNVPRGTTGLHATHWTLDLRQDWEAGLDLGGLQRWPGPINNSRPGGLHHSRPDTPTITAHNPTLTLARQRGTRGRHATANPRHPHAQPPTNATLPVTSQAPGGSGSPRPPSGTGPTGPGPACGHSHHELHGSWPKGSGHTGCRPSRPPGPPTRPAAHLHIPRQGGTRPRERPGHRARAPAIAKHAHNSYHPASRQIGRKGKPGPGRHLANS